MTYEDTLEALSDPTRRALFERLRESPCSVGELVEIVPVSQPAVSQHLKVLKEARLVRVRKLGNRRIYRLDPEGLLPLRQYLEGVWGEVLEAFHEAAENQRRYEMKEKQQTNSMVPPVVKSINVGIPINAAFQLFTEGIASWWPLSSHSVGEENTKVCFFEGKEGGRIYEIQEDGAEALWGHVQVWDPPRRFVTTWHPGRESTTAQELEVKFSTTSGGTLVELTHRGWESLGEKALETREGYVRGWDIVLKPYIALSEKSEVEG